MNFLHKHKRILRLFALTLSFTILFEVVFPTISYALTSGPTMPEVYGNQPVDATDNVSLASGAFNYTIPITSIPEYPMAIGYSSGQGMDDESTCFGFGFNGFSGAIGRTAIGIPDDINNGNLNYNYDNQDNWNASLETEILETEIIATEAAYALIGFDNYKGFYGAVGYSVNVGIPGFSYSYGFDDDSRTGASANLGFQLGWKNYTLSGSNIASVKAENSNWIKETGKGLVDLKDAIFNISSFPQSTGNTSLLNPVANVFPTSSGFGINITIPIPLPEDPTTIFVFIGKYSNFEFGTGDLDKNAFGYMYLNNYDRSQLSHLADMAVEGEQLYNASSRNTISHLQKDNFYINCQGLSGGMQLYQQDYGVVSRNYNRFQSRELVDIIDLNTQRKETSPWYNATNAVVNKNLDILSLLKNNDNGSDDFDNTIFTTSELLGFKEPFTGTPKFRIRGDLSGDFNIASTSYSDYSPNTFNLNFIQGTGSYSTSFLATEHDMPVYYPQVNAPYGQNYTGQQLINSTNIVSFTISDVVSQYNDISSGFSSTCTTSTGCSPCSSSYPSDQTKSLKFQQSIFSHTELTYPTSGPGVSGEQVGGTPSSGSGIFPVNAANTQPLNILTHIQNVGAATDVIADIRVKKTDGMTYIFNLPVFAKTRSTLSMSTKGGAPPVAINSNGNPTDYASFRKENGNYKNRQKLEKVENYSYPYAWLMTAVVGPDYIDFDDIPGPSDGDLGYWVKFKYVKTSDNYQWRYPFTGLNHNPYALEVINDDVYSASTGTKEVYYLDKIESRDYVSKYNYYSRLDGMDAPATGYFNGSAYNSLSGITLDPSSTPLPSVGNNYSYVVGCVQLFKKQTTGDNSAALATGTLGSLVKATQFTYDYSMCSGLPNSYNSVSSSPILPNTIYYHCNYGASGSFSAETGKLTLRKVQHIAYDANGNPSPLPSYQFKYSWETQSDATLNPSYDWRAIDMWGNYSANSKYTPNISPAANPGYLGSYYNNYQEIDNVTANHNANVFALTKISLPSGGFMQVGYEAGGYGSVQDQDPYVMRNVIQAVQQSNVPATGKKGDILTVDITDLYRNGKDLRTVIPDPATNTNAKTILYGELAFYQSNYSALPPDPSQLYMQQDSGQVVSIDPASAITSQNGRYYQNITVQHTTDPTDSSAFISPCQNYMGNQSLAAKAFMEASSLTVFNCNAEKALIDKYEGGATTSPLDVIGIMTNSLLSYLAYPRPDVSNCIGPLCSALFPGYSFLRTPMYQEKYTGTRVQSITYNDQFNYSSNTGGRSNNYVTNYFYDSLGNGTGASSGVATIEMGGGKSCIVDMYNTPGAGFFPSPQIYYAQTTVQTGYKTLPSSSPTSGDVISRQKGRTEYSFYTPQDNTLKFANNFTTAPIQQGQHPSGYFSMFGIWSYLFLHPCIRFFHHKHCLNIKIPIWLPVFVFWNRQDNYNMASYAYTDVSDMYGKPKQIIQRSASGEAVSEQTYTYFGENDGVKTLSGSTSVDPFTNTSSQVIRKPGRIDQIWSEEYYTEESDINLFPPIWTFKATTNRNFCHTTMKSTYLPAQMKQITTIKPQDGINSTTTYTAFDAYSGQPLEVRNQDSYKNTKISRIVPAYWEYPDMGPADMSSSNLNLLTNTTGSYQYLNDSTSDVSNLLSASVTEWSKNEWGFTNGMVVDIGNMYSNPNNIQYLYTPLSATELDGIYNTSGQTVSGLPQNIQNNVTQTGKSFCSKDYFTNSNIALYRAYKKYVYKVDVTDQIQSNGIIPAGVFSIASPFDYSKPPVQPDPAWQLVTTNTLFDQKGDVAESRDILNKYAAAYFGYNFSFGVATVANSSWNGSIYEGAENTYADASGNIYLDETRVNLQDAVVVSDNCQTAFSTQTLNYSSLASNATAFSFTVPSGTAPNTTMLRLNAVFTVAGNQIARTLIVSQDEGQAIKIISNRGEVFNGYYVINPGGTNNYTLLFDPTVVTSLSINNDQTGTAAIANNQTEFQCSVGSKTYNVPASNCVGEVHTGDYAFALNSNGQGTAVTINKSALPVASEFNRKYTAMVWVHNSSPLSTQLVITTGSSATVSQTKSCTLSAPYLTAGNWSLLRVDIDPPISTDTQINVYVQNVNQNNSSSGIAIYDDFRVQPFTSSLEATVYDHQFGRIVAKLNKDNLATFYQYDIRGRLIEVKSELENIGPVALKKYLYNDQKTN